MIKRETTSLSPFIFVKEFSLLKRKVVELREEVRRILLTFLVSLRSFLNSSRLGLSFHHSHLMLDHSTLNFFGLICCRFYFLFLLYNLIFIN